MAETPAERALARSYTAGDGRETYTVTGFSAAYHADRTVTLTYELTVTPREGEDERWEWTLRWDDKSFADVFTADEPDPERLDMLVRLVRSLIEEWWATKGHNRKSAKMARRLP
ncbi:hypothetical protein [Streptomyces sp. ODS28]|uniref:hypothetical protein n=1 Tax=Streptomyces sp. ODS28 TaxID=3136688 RepID=UPI0031EC6020